MNCSPSRMRGDVVVVEDLLGAGQAEGGAGDDHRLGGGPSPAPDREPVARRGLASTCRAPCVDRGRARACRLRSASLGVGRSAAASSSRSAARRLGRSGRRRSARPTPRPAAYSPHSAWLNDGDVAALRVVGEQREHVVVSPSTSSTKPCSAFFGPTSTKTRAPASYSVCRPLTNCTGEATWRPSMSSIVVATSAPVG